MTPDQEATFKCLEMVINEPRQDGLLDAIRLAFREHKAEMMRPVEKPKPWYKRLFITRTSNGRAVRSFANKVGEP